MVAQGSGTAGGSAGGSGGSPKLRSMDQHKQEGQKSFAPSADRNKEPILAAIRPLLEPLPGSSLVLEIASGTGQHAAHFAAALPNLTWQPTEQDAASAPSIAAWTAGLPNVRPPAVLNATESPETWPVGAGSCSAIFAANVTHISPWPVTLGLVAGAARALQPGGLLLLYGPFAVDGTIEPESNRVFDQSLRGRDLAWGYRDVQDIAAAAGKVGLALELRLSMPANNYLLVMRSHGSSSSS